MRQTNIELLVLSLEGIFPSFDHPKWESLLWKVIPERFPFGVLLVLVHARLA